MSNYRNFIFEALEKLFVHVPLAMFISPIMGSVLSLSLVKDDVPYGISFWGTACLIGFFVNRTMRDRTVYLVALVGILLMSALIVEEFHEYETLQHQENSFCMYVYDYSFTTNKKQCVTSGCVSEIFTTPFITSLSYTVGAVLGLWLGNCLNGKENLRHD